MDRPIDLRSDTVTRPTAAMRMAMAEAEVGDDVYGEDPTIRRLEEETAARLGLSRGLFVPSATQANQIAIGVHCRPGDELICDENSHCVVYEGGAVSALWGVQPRMLHTTRGIFTGTALQAALRGENVHYARTRLVTVENTHNRGGGVCWPLETFTDVVRTARSAKLAVHLDGARLLNAEAATGVRADAFARQVDSASLCFSKGLGAPVGSVLCGSEDFIHEARRLRKRLGGGMRQAGILAAAALYALHHHVERLVEDHVHARRLATGLAALPGVRVDLEAVETNLVFADFPVAAEQLVARLAQQGVLCNPGGLGPGSVRFVTHLDVRGEDIDRALSILATTLTP